jgi:hypothetical protein
MLAGMGTRAIETGLRPSGSVRPTTMRFFEAALGTASRGSAGLHATAPRQAAKSMAPPGSQPPHTPIRGSNDGAQNGTRLPSGRLPSAPARRARVRRQRRRQYVRGSIGPPRRPVRLRLGGRPGRRRRACPLKTNIALTAMATCPPGCRARIDGGVVSGASARR